MVIISLVRAARSIRRGTRFRTRLALGSMRPEGKPERAASNGEEVILIRGAGTPYHQSGSHDLSPRTLPHSSPDGAHFWLVTPAKKNSENSWTTSDP